MCSVLNPIVNLVHMAAESTTRNSLVEQWYFGQGSWLSYERPVVQSLLGAFILVQKWNRYIWLRNPSQGIVLWSSGMLLEALDSQMRCPGFNICLAPSYILVPKWNWYIWLQNLSQGIALWSSGMLVKALHTHTRGPRFIPCLVPTSLFQRETGTFGCRIYHKEYPCGAVVCRWSLLILIWEVLGSILAWCLHPWTRSWSLFVLVFLLPFFGLISICSNFLHNLTSVLSWTCFTFKVFDLLGSTLHIFSAESLVLSKK